MAYKYPLAKLNNGLFGPTMQQHFYLPISYHNKSSKKNTHKNRWALKQYEQYEVFRVCDEGNWECVVNKGKFSILCNGDEILGKNEERLSFFPTPSNPSDPWHGYPVDSSVYEISTTLVDQWLCNNIIDARIHIKILKGQL